jgi:hypothetical protein
MKILKIDENEDIFGGDIDDNDTPEDEDIDNE